MLFVSNRVDFSNPGGPQLFKSLKHLSFIFCALLLGACTTTKPEAVFGRGYKIDPKAVTVMTYNMENLFDTEDDPEKKDESFLPLAKKTKKILNICKATNDNPYYARRCMEDDWSESDLEMKMKRLAHVIRRVRDGRGPDILIVEEIENQPVLERFRREYLADLGYKPAILLEGPDERGIDVGIITRFEMESAPVLHQQTFVANDKLKEDQIRPTRGILEVNLKLPDGSGLTVLGAHLPSQGAPTETRRQAVMKIQEIKSKLPADRMVIVGGDFNITSDEDLKERYVSKDLAASWGVSHIIGCEECQGTYYYRRLDQWSFLDILLLSQNMLDSGNAPWVVLPQSIRIENESRYQLSRYGTPSRFSNRRKDGVSDHWPMVLEIVPRPVIEVAEAHVVTPPPEIQWGNEVRNAGIVYSERTQTSVNAQGELTTTTTINEIRKEIKTDEAKASEPEKKTKVN